MQNQQTEKKGEVYLTAHDQYDPPGIDTAALRDSARWVQECVNSLLREIDPPADPESYGRRPGTKGALMAMESAVQSAQVIARIVPTSAKVHSPDFVWLLDGDSGVVHGTKMLWGSRKTCCGKGGQRDDIYRLGGPGEVTCKAHGCRCIGGKS